MTSIFEILFVAKIVQKSQIKVNSKPKLTPKNDLNPRDSLIFCLMIQLPRQSPDLIKTLIIGPLKIHVPVSLFLVYIFFLVPCDDQHFSGPTFRVLFLVAMERVCITKYLSLKSFL